VSLVAPCPSVPPGAGNETKKAIKPRKRAEKVEERYVGQAGLIDRHVDAPTIRGDGHGDPAAILGSEPAQCGLHVFRPQRPCGVPAV